MIGVRSQRKMVPGLQGSQRVTTSQLYIDRQPLFQNVMNRAYAKWQANRDWRYEDFLMNLNAADRRCVIMGNLNYQVCNGGFSQWIFNHYINPNLEPMILDALSLIKTETGLAVRALVGEVIEILHKDFEYRNGAYEVERSSFSYWDENEDDFYDYTIDKLDGFDENFYAINEQWLHDIERKLRLNNGVLHV